MWVVPIAAIIILFIPVFSCGEISQQAFLGTIKEINCNEQQLELTTQEGRHWSFILDKNLSFKRIQGCEALEKGMMVIAIYTEGDKSIVLSIKPVYSKKEQ